MSDTPTSIDPRAACPIGSENAGPLCLLRHNRQLSTTKLVRLSRPKDLAEMVVAAGKPIELDSIHCSPHAPPPASGPNRPSLHRCERSSLVKNRKLEICTSGSVRGEGGNILTYSASRRTRRRRAPMLRMAFLMLRSWWSKGRGPRGTRTSKARTGPRVGSACHRRSSAYGKLQG